MASIFKELHPDASVHYVPGPEAAPSMAQALPLADSQA